MMMEGFSTPSMFFVKIKTCWNQISAKLHIFAKYSMANLLFCDLSISFSPKFKIIVILSANCVLVILYPSPTK